MRGVPFSIAILVTLVLGGLVSAQDVNPFGSDPVASADPFAPSAPKKPKEAKPLVSGNRTATVSHEDKTWEDKTWDARIHDALDSQCVLSYDETPWMEIEEALESQFKINIVLDQSARDDSLTEDEPVSCNLKGLSLRKALRIMLRKKNAAAIVKNEVLLIISLDDAEDSRFMVHSFINVRPLLARLKELEKDRIGTPRLVYRLPVATVIPVVGSVETNFGGHSGNSGGAGGVFNVQALPQKKAPVKQPQVEVASTKEESKAVEPQVPVEMVTAESLLIDLIHSSCDHETWYKTGNGLATCDIVGGIVVARTTPEGADNLQEFLESLTESVLKD